MAKLYFRYGAMGCGKTMQLLQVAFNYEERGHKVCVVKPQTDTKNGTKLLTRIGPERETDFCFNKKTNLLNMIKQQYKDVHCVLVDEAQFLTPAQVDQLMLVTIRLNIPVMCYGLRLNFLRKDGGFEGATRLLQIAHDIEESWKEFLKTEFEKPYFKELAGFLHSEYETKTIYPRKELVFRAFATDLNEVKVVILGQDPYHTPGAAEGLAFSVPNSQPIPPSLVNIYKEIDSDIGRHKNPRGSLANWQKQGVLLLNTVLTVEAHKPKSHSGKGWETFTTATIEYLNSKRPHLVFILWGRDARNKKPLIDASKHLIIESAHPSPLSAYNGFFGSKPFSKCNEFLVSHGLEPTVW